MTGLNRRKFLKNTALGAGALYFFPLNASLDESRFIQAVPLQMNEGLRIFDPWLDENCKKVLPETSEKWNSTWIWYPGQKTAHVNSRRVAEAVSRCRHIGYPGNFCQPVYYAWFRKKLMVSANSGIRWTGPTGRISFLVDGVEGDITNRTDIVEPGMHLIEMKVDFSRSLPCIMVEGEGFSDPEGWEVSLDQKTWKKPEWQHVVDEPGILPDSKHEIVVEIPVNRVVSTENVVVSDKGFNFSHGGSLIADLWHDEIGCIAFNAEGEGKLSFFTGESLLEVKETDPDKLEQQPIPEIGIDQIPRNYILPERCARYIQIKSTGTCIISNLHFKANITPVNYKGGFSCNDIELNEIWAAGAATIHSCMHDFYLDGIKRDALSWADAIMAIPAADCVFFDKEIANNSIISQLLPINASLKDFGIGDYPPFIFLGFEHDFLVRGDLTLLQNYQENLFNILDVYMSLQDEKGFISGKNFKTWGFFPDWSMTPETGPERKGIPCYSQMLIMKSFEVGGSIAEKLNLTRKAKLYKNAASKMRKQIRETFWDGAVGAFLNGIDSDGKLDKRTTSYAQVWGILFDLVKPEEYNTVFGKVLDNPERNTQSYSLNQIYECLAYAKAGRTGSFLNRLKLVWGGMLNDGCSRFAEDIRPWQSPAEKLTLYGRPFANSLCHVWSGAAPVLALSKCVLGIYSTAAGFSECIIKPQLAELEWIKGSVPTPTGNITIELTKLKGGMLTLPDKVKANLSGIATVEGKAQIVGPGTFSIVVK